MSRYCYSSTLWREVLFALVLLIFVVMGLESCGNNQRKNEIYNKLQETKAQEIHIEQKSICFDKTPFSWNSKEMRIYHFTYVENGEKKEGWVRFKPFGDNWLLDYKGEIK